MNTRIYLTNTETLDDKSLYEALYDFMPKSRKEKIDSYRFDKDKKLSLAAGALLRFALIDSRVFATTDDMEIVVDANGKPFLKKHQNVHFNLSHSGGMAMCVISDREVGCDVEQITNNCDKLSIADKYFPTDEKQLIQSQKDDDSKQTMFFKLWTLHESFMKATGLGLSLPFDAVCFSPVSTTDKAEFIVSDAAAKPVNSQVAVMKWRASLNSKANTTQIAEDEYIFYEFQYKQSYQCSLCIKNCAEDLPELIEINLNSAQFLKKFKNT